MIRPRTGPWKLTDLAGIRGSGQTVFSCFHCGGGSTMGYKLAGFDVLGGVEIDPDMMKIYRKNHNPRLSYLMGVREFADTPDEKLPKELFNLDILDGSPPCSSFSMAGSREDAWGEKKVFREGQADQVLDDLFFDFIAIAAKLRPKVVVAENVKGLIMGAARGYVKEIFAHFERAGYETQLFVLNASRMGVPQARERTVFVARRRDLKLPKLAPSFEERVIPLSEAFEGTSALGAKALTPKAAVHWGRTPRGKLFSVAGADTGKMNRRLDPRRPAWTQTATPNLYHWSEPRGLSPTEAVRVQTFPDDFDFCGQKPGYVCGMSVPPFMMQRIASTILEQLLEPPKPASDPVVSYDY